MAREELSMKKKVLWILLIALTCLALYIVYLKFNTSVEEKPDVMDDSEMVVDKDKIILSTWDSWNNKIYNDDGELISENTTVISLVFYEKTVKICVRDDNICEELDYTETDEEVKITYSSSIKFSGTFKKIISSEIGTVALEQVNDNGNRVVYYFYQPAG